MRKNDLNAEEFEGIAAITGAGRIIRAEEALEAFCEDRQRKGIRESTILYYRNQINYLFRYFMREHEAIPAMNEITTELLDEFVKYLRYERGNKDGGINAKIRAIRTFLNYCEEVGFIKYNPAKVWKQIKTRDPEINAFTGKQLKQLFMQPNIRRFTGLRDRLLMMFLFDTGARISEALAVKVEDLHYNERRALLRDTKSGYSRYVPLSDELIAHLRQFLKIHDGMSEYIFVGLSGKPIDKNHFRLTMNAYGKKAGIKGVRVSPHTFRHTFAKFYILNGGDAFSLMQIMGHSTTDMTKRYVRLFSTEIVEKHRRYSPLKNL
ncbi:tyrosine-type recombinase/integrase [Planococcus sp. S3-L1]|uniref:tyrosine-type recombinase/integrase n=1 Tax=Planococcus sp. S3-L1 TaxID=3046200 RepID=UPI0024B90E83|nr:tyrosine-type recombinase/integrase [Planococcus sp. S3-L1]MDJ0332124.1 tyrosine-type recombinase/integrase [Planococcus sp. S3-L1]